MQYAAGWTNSTPMVEQARRLRLLTDIAARAGAALDSDWRNTDWDAELYDENGLPR